MTRYLRGSTGSKNLVTPIINYQDLLNEQDYTQLKDLKKQIYYDTDDLGITYYLNDGNKMPAMVYNTSLGPMDEPTRIIPAAHKLAKLIEHVLKIGYRHLDTASVYRTEAEIGLGIYNFLYNNLEVKRENLFISTKLWNDSHDRKDVIPALQKSLQKLRLDYVDLYVMHFPFAYTKKGSIKMTDYLETWKGMQDAKDKGLARSIGVANFNLEQMKRLWEKARIKPAVLQIEVNPTITQEELVNWCQEQGVMVMGFYPFGAIFKDDYNCPPIRANHPLLRLISQKYKKNVRQILLRYLLDRNIIPLPRSKNKLRIRDYSDVYDFNLSPQEVSALSAFNCDFRLRPVVQWYPHPHYPFEKEKSCSKMKLKHIEEHNKDL